MATKAREYKEAAPLLMIPKLLKEKWGSNIKEAWESERSLTVFIKKHHIDEGKESNPFECSVALCMNEYCEREWNGTHEWAIFKRRAYCLNLKTGRVESYVVPSRSSTEIIEKVDTKKKTEILKNYITLRPTAGLSAARAALGRIRSLVTKPAMGTSPAFRRGSPAYLKNLGLSD